MIKLLIKASMLFIKNYFISGHRTKLLKYLRQLKTRLSYSESSVAFAHKSQISLQNPLIDSYTSSLYLLAYNNIDYKVAPLHLITYSFELLNFIRWFNIPIHF